MRRLSLLLLVVLALLLGTPHKDLLSQDLPSGDNVTVIDGDTLQVGRKIVQLYGIDAPELGQQCQAEGSLRPCGVEAALALRKLVTLANSSFHCSRWDDGSRAAAAEVTVEVCEVGDEDVSLIMLHGGYVVALPGRFPDYAKAQDQAREARLGLWHSKFVLPWKWREGERLPSERAGCNVKATITPEGQQLYYVPTDPNYDRIATDPARSDAVFCSDEEARAAGWRRPGEDAAPD